jgi:hypothetical protein
MAAPLTTETAKRIENHMTGYAKTTNTTTDLTALLDAAEYYRSRSYKPIPLTDGKIPRGIAEWQKRTFDSASIKSWLDKATVPGIGVQMGPYSGIIDAEWDTPAQRAKAYEIFGDTLDRAPAFGRPDDPDHEHRILAWTDRWEVTKTANLSVPCDDGTDLILRLGAGGKGSQSAFPPSRNKAWLDGRSLEDCDPPMPSEGAIEMVIAIAVNGEPTAGRTARPASSASSNGHASLLQRAAAYVAKADAVSEPGRNKRAFNLAGHVASFDENGDRLSESEIYTLLAPWNLRNSPPLDDRELRECVASSLKNGKPRPAKESRHQGGSATDNGAAAEAAPGATDNGTATAAAAFPGDRREALAAVIGDPNLRDWFDLQLIKHNSNPVRWSIASKMFAKAPGGCLEFASTNKMTSAHAVENIAVECADVSLKRTGVIYKRWPLIYGVLLDHIEVREVEAEECRDRIVARIVLHQLEVAFCLSDDKYLSETNLPARTSDRVTWFKTEGLFEHINNWTRSLKIEWGELRASLKIAGVADTKKRLKADGKVVALRFVTQDGIEKLRQFAYPGAVEDDSQDEGEGVTL